MKVFHKCKYCNKHLSWLNDEDTYGFTKDSYWVLYNETIDHEYAICYICRSPKLLELQSKVRHSGSYL